MKVKFVFQFLFLDVDVCVKSFHLISRTVGIKDGKENFNRTSIKRKDGESVKASSRMNVLVLKGEMTSFLVYQKEKE